MASEAERPIEEKCFACKSSLFESTRKRFSNMCPFDEKIVHMLKEILHLEFTPTASSFLCDNCFIKISNFKNFLSDCNQNNDVMDEVVSSRESSVIVNAPETATGDKCGSDPGFSSQDRPSVIFGKTGGTEPEEIANTLNRNGVSGSHTSDQSSSLKDSTVNPSSEVVTYVETTSDLVTRSNEIIPPFQVPTGTLMLKKEASIVYILPDGTTYELFQNASKSAAFPVQQSNTVHSGLALGNAGTSINSPPIVQMKKGNGDKPDQKKLQLRESSSRPKPTIIITDSIPVPTLLLPPTDRIISQMMVPNKEGKIPISRIKRPVRIQGPPKILPKADSFACDLQCPKCSILFSSEDLLREHMKLHPDVRSCVICHKPYLNLNDLVGHIRRNHPRHLCPRADCNFYSAHLPSMNNHALVHSNKKDFKCPECNKCFKTKGHLRSHNERRHSNHDKTFDCHLCEKKFKWKSSLQNHLKFHATGAIMCSQCEHTFQSQESLARHLHAFHSEGTNPYTCENCGQVCSDRHSKERHWRTHFKEQYKTVECPIEGCSFREFYEYRVRNHVARVHKDKESNYRNKEKSIPCEAGSTSGTPANSRTSDTLTLSSNQEAARTCSYSDSIDAQLSANQVLAMDREMTEKLVSTIHRLRERLQPPLSNEAGEKTAEEMQSETYQVIPESNAAVSELVNVPNVNLDSNSIESPLVYQHHDQMPSGDEVVYHEVVVESSEITPSHGYSDIH